MTGQIQALAAEAQSLATHAPDDPSKEASAGLRDALDELAQALEADRTLRLELAAPDPDQLSYSTALIHQHVQALQRVLQTPSQGLRPAATPLLSIRFPLITVCGSFVAS